MRVKGFVTGSARYFGMRAVFQLLAPGDQMVGVDNLNYCYDVALKDARLVRIT